MTRMTTSHHFHVGFGERQYDVLTDSTFDIHFNRFTAYYNNQQFSDWRVDWTSETTVDLGIVLFMDYDTTLPAGHGGPGSPAVVVARHTSVSFSLLWLLALSLIGIAAVVRRRGWPPRRQTSGFEVVK